MLLLSLGVPKSSLVSTPKSSGLEEKRGIAIAQRYNLLQRRGRWMSNNKPAGRAGGQVKKRSQNRKRLRNSDIGSSWDQAYCVRDG
jgi:hypothetical protein